MKDDSIAAAHSSDSEHCPKLETFEIHIANEGGHAETGAFGVAIAGLQANAGAILTSKAEAGEYGFAITTHRGEAKVGKYGVAAAGKGGVASGGAGVFATVSDGGHASVGDGGVARIAGYRGRASATTGVAYCMHGDLAETTDYGTALAESGKARSGARGIAAIRESGVAMVKEQGVAIHWNGGMVSAGEGGVIILGYTDPNTGKLHLKTGQMKPEGDLEPDRLYTLNGKHEIVPVKE